MDKTYRQKIADLTVNGKWYWYNYFIFQVQRIENGQPAGYIEGTPTGENIGGCAICGTLITNHFSIRDAKSGRIVNVGSECIKKVLGESKATKIEKAVRSLRNKIRSNYLRPFKHDLISKWLTSPGVAEKADEIRVPRKMEEMHEYWMGQVRKGLRSRDKDEYRGESFNTLCKKWDETTRDGGYFYGTKYFWKSHAEQFPRKDWNPDNMRSQYKIEAEKYGTALPPKWSEIKLTDEQKKELSQSITVKVNEYIEKLTKTNNR